MSPVLGFPFFKKSGPPPLAPISFSEDWANLSPFVASSETIFGAISGAAGVSSGKLIASSYGTGANWHGPIIEHVTTGFTDVDFTASYSAVSNNNNQYFQCAICLAKSGDVSNTSLLAQITDFSAENQIKNRFFSIGMVTPYSVTNDTTNRTDVPIRIRVVGSTVEYYWNGSLVYSGTHAPMLRDTILLRLTQFASAAVYPTLSIGPITLNAPS